MKSIAIMVALLASAAYAEDRLIVADSSSSGTYHAMMSEVAEFCSNEEVGLNITELPQKGGATDNLDALVNNRASVAILHSDVLTSASMGDAKYKQLKVLVNLYPEEVHVIALRSLKVGGHFGMGGSEAQTLADLKGMNVVAAGGGCITAKLLQGQGEGGFNVTCKDSGKEVIPSLESGESQAAIFVGGAPLTNIEQLNGNKFKLLSIPESISNRVQNVYKTTNVNVNYPNLKSGSVRTIAATAQAVTRKYTRPNMIAPQAKFRACFFAHLDDLKETTGKHPKWQQVEASDRGGDNWYDIPEDVMNAATQSLVAPPPPSRKR